MINNATKCRSRQCPSVVFLFVYLKYLLRFTTRIIAFITTDVTQYANSGLDKKKLCKEAKRICDKYLGTGSDAPVINLHNLIVKQIMNELKNATPQLFDAARQDVEALLRTSFIQFAAEA